MVQTTSPVVTAKAEIASASLLKPRLLQPRMESIDLLRGLIMIIMAIDHTRDFFTNATVDPTDPIHSWPALFATRWITHLCAPGFVALAGLSVALQRQRGKSVQLLRGFLRTRGLWLVLFDLVGWGFIISFCLPPAFTVGPLFVSGAAMIALSFVLALPARGIGLIGMAILALGDLLDPIHVTGTGPGALLWDLLHQRALIETHGLTLALQYPVLPWIGVLFVGYWLGSLLSAPAETRQRGSVGLGLACLALFAVLRSVIGYGNPFPFVTERTPTSTIMSFLSLEKYPPSLQYVLATGGVLLLLFALLDRLATIGAVPRLRAFLDVYGRTPFFFYAVHFILLHMAALTLSAVLHQDIGQWMMPLAFIRHRIPGWGFGLPGIYAIWVLLLLVLYWPCRWFAALKARRRDWWLSYL